MSPSYTDLMIRNGPLKFPRVRPGKLTQELQVSPRVHEEVDNRFAVLVTVSKNNSPKEQREKFDFNENDVNVSFNVIALIISADPDYDAPSEKANGFDAEMHAFGVLPAVKE